MKYLLLLGTVVFTVFGQLILKWRITQYPSLPDSMSDKMTFILKLLLDPLIIAGFAAAFLASLFWIGAMTQFDVSYAYPFITGGLTILTVFFAVMVLNEAVTVYKVLGSLLIVAGVLAMSLGE